ncbi:MAG TPA: tRNA (5-methylaminomethyl-2-thiouridine)(34)-methyltransferase MnmD [Pseudomonadales bacterium]|nr:tRNA (5-methylaminomethyl-2-thiouridine)(34)-methyltransferase MnmD [Pseudomonadales bacterium]
MSAAHPRLLAAAVIDWQDGTPVSRRSGDVYFSRQDAVAEARRLFIDGNALPARFAALGADGATDLCIGETGFGMGLNFLLARRAFLDAAPGGACLDFVSVEHAPVAGDDLRRCAAVLADGGHDDLAAAMGALAERLPPPLTGWHRLLFDAGRVRLSLWYGDALAGFADWEAQRAAAPGARAVDAWFLDGFAPRLDADLWSPALCAQLARLSAQGATLGTFTVARAVREALRGAGFAVERRTEARRTDGRGGKRQVLHGRLAAPGAGPDGAVPDKVPGALAEQAPGDPRTAQPRAMPPRPPRDPVLIVGAGLAGACVASALARRGRRVLVIDALAPAAAASGNPWAVLHPRLPMDDGPRAPWLLAAHHFAAAMLDELGTDAGWRPAPVLQVPEARRPERLVRLLRRFAALAPLIAEQTFAGAPALLQRRGGHADLPRLIRTLLDHPLIETRSGVAAGRLERQDGAWHLGALGTEAPEGTRGPRFEQVVLAMGADTPRLLPELPVGRMRGQVTRVRTAAAPRSAGAADAILTGRGHAIALDDGWVCGSSYVRDGDAGPPTAAERDANLQRLAAWLRDLDADAGTEHTDAERPAAAEVVEEFTGVRATVPDRSPLVGAMAPGLWLSCGHASSGLTTCPLAGEFLAASLSGEPPVLDAELVALLDPRRYAGAARTDR